jgi:hypothetical protein
MFQNFNRAFAFRKRYGFFIFSCKYFKKAFEIQIFRILESLVDFLFNFEFHNLGLKTFKKLKKLSFHVNFLKRELF